MFMLKEMDLELISRISFSQCVAFFILQLSLFSVTALPKNELDCFNIKTNNMLVNTVPGGGIKYNFKRQLLV